MLGENRMLTRLPGSVRHVGATPVNVGNVKLWRGVSPREYML